MTDEELFKEIYEELERLEKRIGTILTEYDWREIPYLLMKINERDPEWCKRRYGNKNNLNQLDNL